MITQHDIEEAIAECQGERNPNANTCIKLAAFYTIRNELFSMEKVPAVESGYSYAPPPQPAENTISYASGSEFAEAINGRKQEEVWPIIDELVSSVQVLMPRLYNGFLRKLND